MARNDRHQRITSLLDELNDKQKCRVKNKHGWIYDNEVEVFVRSIPKVELHVHLDGSFDPILLKSHLDRDMELHGEEMSSCVTYDDEVVPPSLFNHIPTHTTLPWDNSKFPVRSQILSAIGSEKSIDPFFALCTCRRDSNNKNSLYEMIKCFEIFVPIVRGNLDLLESLSYDLCKRQKEQNIIYTEVRYCPHLLATNGSFNKTSLDVDPIPVIDAVTRGLRKGQVDFDIIVNQIFCGLSWRPDWSDEIVTLASERTNAYPCAVVGIDIAAGEEHFDSKTYPDLHTAHLGAFQRAQNMGLNVTMHAGEVDYGAGQGTGSENVKTAVEKYNAKRIGHGYRVVQSSSIMEELRNRIVHFEVCPTSSVETGGWDYKSNEPDNVLLESSSNKSRVRKDWKSHPAVTMIKAGLSVGFNSDDPSVFDTSLTWQLRTAICKMELTSDQIVKSMFDSIDASFANDQIKKNLRKRLDKFLFDYRTHLGNPSLHHCIICREED